jgi:hypothetical protein
VEIAGAKFQAQPARRAILISNALQAKRENTEAIDPMHLKHT